LKNRVTVLCRGISTTTILSTITLTSLNYYHSSQYCFVIRFRFPFVVRFLSILQITPLSRCFSWCFSWCSWCFLQWIRQFPTRTKTILRKYDDDDLQIFKVRNTIGNTIGNFQYPITNNNNYNNNTINNNNNNNNTSSLS
jgi:hypothetical protein